MLTRYYGNSNSYKSTGELIFFYWFKLHRFVLYAVLSIGQHWLENGIPQIGHRIDGLWSPREKERERGLFRPANQVSEVFAMTIAIRLVIHQKETHQRAGTRWRWTAAFSQRCPPMRENALYMAERINCSIRCYRPVKPRAATIDPFQRRWFDSRNAQRQVDDILSAAATTATAASAMCYYSSLPHLSLINFIRRECYQGNVGRSWPQKYKNLNYRSRVGWMCHRFVNSFFLFG